MNKELINHYAEKYDDVEFRAKHTAGVVRLSDGTLLGIDKPRIETHFCFADEGPTLDTYNVLRNDESRLRAYFFRRNLEELDRYITGLHVKKDEYQFILGAWKNLSNEYGAGAATLCFRRYFDISDKGLIDEDISFHEKEPHFYPFSSEEKAEILAALQKIRAAFEKRLMTYWKRYGAKKLHLWTYWADA